MNDRQRTGSNDTKKEWREDAQSRIALLYPDVQHQPLAYTEPKAAQQMNDSRCLGFQTQTFRGMAGAWREVKFETIKAQEKRHHRHQ